MTSVTAWTPTKLAALKEAVAAAKAEGANEVTFVEREGTGPFGRIVETHKTTVVYCEGALIPHLEAEFAANPTPPAREYREGKEGE